MTSEGPEQHYTKYMFSLFLVIETAPKINLDLLQKEYKVKKGEDVTIEVKYTSTPKPDDEWFVNGKLVKKSKRVNIYCVFRS
jgi:membrane carboxypeptidase/penicillin-binding protein PbpC